MHKFHSVLRCWACISGPLGLKKGGSKEKIDEGLVQLKSPQIVAHLSFWLTKLLLDKCNSHLLQMTFWTFDGDHVLHNSEKMLFIIAHKCLFHPALAAPSGDGGEERRLPQAIPARVPPTATITGWLEIPILENCYCEEIWWGTKLIGQKNEPKDWKCVYGSIVLADANITIFTLFILINSEELALLVGNSLPFVVDLSLWRLALPCQL